MIPKTKTLLIFVLVLIINSPGVFAHPHPIMEVSAEGNTISIRSLHVQPINPQYIHDNFVLESCDYELVEAYSKMLETYITLKHDCDKLIVKKNTLFVDYWGSRPITISMYGLEEQDSGKNESTSFFSDLRSLRMPKNVFLMIPFLFLLGFIFSFSGDFFSYILPVSLSSKAEQDSKLWLKSWGLHIVSTYFVLIASLSFFSSYLVKYSGFLILLVAVLMFLETYLHRNHVSPLLVALIPCSGSIFVFTLLQRTNIVLAYFSPLIMNLGDIILLKTASFIPFPKKFAKAIPFAIGLVGVFVLVKTLVIPVAGLTALDIQANVPEDYLVKNGDTVKASYFGGFEDKDIYGPIKMKTVSFKVGNHEVIKGLDDAVVGMKKGEIKDVTILPKDGFGEVNSSLIKTFPINMFPKDFIPIEGENAYVTGINGEIYKVSILKVKSDSVVLDFNDALAGKTLYYRIMLEEIKPTGY